MQTVILVIHLMIVMALIVVVLLQRSEGGGLGMGSGGGGGNFMSSRGTANALTRATAILAGAFFLTSVILTWMATQARGPRTILDQPAATAPAVPSAPASPQVPASGQPGQGGTGVLDQLRGLSPQPGSQPPQPR